jgi:hypothetical protein
MIASDASSLLSPPITAPTPASPSPLTDAHGCHDSAHKSLPPPIHQCTMTLKHVQQKAPQNVQQKAQQKAPQKVPQKEQQKVQQTNLQTVLVVFGSHAMLPYFPIPILSMTTYFASAFCCTLCYHTLLLLTDLLILLLLLGREHSDFHATINRSTTQA